MTAHKLAEEALKAEERRLRWMVEHLPAGAAFVNGESLYLNPRVEKITGYKPSEVPTLDQWFGALYPGKSEEVRRLYQADKAAGFPATRVVPITRKDGAERLLEFAAYGDDSGEVWLINDVTDRAHAEEKFRVLFEYSSDAHLLFDENGIMDCNNAALAMVGCAEKSQIVGLHPAVLSPTVQPDGRTSAEKSVEMDAIAKKQGYHRFEWIHRRLDGTEFPVEVTLNLVKLGGRYVLLTVWHDLTESKRKEAEIIRAREHLRLALIGSKLALFEWNISTGEIFLTERWAEMIGAPPGVTRTTMNDLMALVHSDDLEKLKEMTLNVLNGNVEFYDTEHRVRSVSGNWFWIRSRGQVVDRDARGRALRLSGTNAEISERKNVEARIRESEAKFRGLIEQSTDGVFVSDAEGNLLLTNSRWCELLGYDMDEVAGINARQTYLEDEREVHIKRLEQVRAGQTLRFERIVKRKNGSTFPAEVSLKMLDSGILQGIFHDITERKQAEETLREAHEKLAVGVAVLDQRNREMALLAELSNFLISCVTVEEACNAIAKYCETLFPEGQGALYLLRASRDYLNRYAYWGAPQEENPPFKPEDCWGLRRGRPHTVFDPQKDAICGHIAAHHKGEPYMCVPLVVQSDLLGLMWITLAEPESSGGGTDAPMNGKQQLAVTLSERIALALSNIRLRENLRQQTIRDALTGLYNRRFLEESLNREMARCKRNGTGFGVLMMDVDHFKRFNDSFGHDAGDGVLRSCAQTLQEKTRKSDIVCRFGGEEFVVVLPDTDQPGAAMCAKNILELVRGLHVSHDGKTLGSITVSIGLAMYPQNGETVTALIQSADKALYAAKGAGRDQVVVAE